MSKQPLKVVKGGIQTTALIGIALLAVGFAGGWFVGHRFQQASMVRQVQAQAKADVQAVEKDKAAVTVESSVVQSYLEDKSTSDTFFVRANEKIKQLYSAPKEKPHSTKSVTTDKHSTQLSESPHDHPIPTLISPVTSDCGDDVLFTPDELRLYNAGNKKADFDPVHAKDLLGQVSGRFAGREERDQGGDPGESQSGSAAVSRLR